MKISLSNPTVYSAVLVSELSTQISRKNLEERTSVPNRPTYIHALTDLVRALYLHFVRGKDLFPSPHFSLCLVHMEHKQPLRQADRPWWRCLAGSSYTILSRWPCSVPAGREHRLTRPQQSSGHSGDTVRPHLQSHWWYGWSRSLQHQHCIFSPDIRKTHGIIHQTGGF